MNNKIYELFIQLSETAIKLGDTAFTILQIEKGFIGNEPVASEEIKKAEQRLGMQLPEDYKDLLMIANGFSAPNAVEPSFLPVEAIDFLQHEHADLIKAYSIDGIEDIGKLLEQSILIGGLDEEQHFLLIPPQETTQPWRYWKFANWIPGEEPYDNLEHYLNTIIAFNLEEMQPS